MAEQLLLLFVCCVMPVAFAALVGFFIVTARRGNTATFDNIHQLGRDLGLTAVAPKGGVMYVGEHQGRAYAIGYGTIGSSASRSYSPGVEVTLEVQARAPWKMYAGCSHYRVGQTYEEAFKARLGADPLAAPARAAMMAFVDSRTRLWLHGDKPLRLRPAPAPESPMYVEHTLGVAAATPAEVRAVLDELTGVALAIEAAH